jgi:hypothetical protein
MLPLLLGPCLSRTAGSRALGPAAAAAASSVHHQTAPMPVPAPGVGGPWIQVNGRRRHRQQQQPQATQPRLPRRAGRGSQPQVPHSAPMGGAASRIPVVLHGRCYNYGDEGHISVNCTNPTRCVLCRGQNHISSECQQQRTLSDAAPPEHSPPAVRLTAGGDIGSRSSTGTPLPRSVDDAERS